MMALSRVKVWGAETLFPADLNGEFDNIIAYINAGLNGGSFASPLTMQGNLDMNAYSILNAAKVFNIYNAKKFATIQAALNAMYNDHGGGIVVLEPATYTADNATIIVPPGVSLVGPSPMSAVISPSWSGPVIRLGSTASSYPTKWQILSGFRIDTSGNALATPLITADNYVASGTPEPTKVLIERLLLTGFGSTTGVGIDLTNVNLRNGMIRSCEFNGLGRGIEATSANSWHVVNSHFVSIQRAIKSTSSRGLRLLGCLFESLGNSNYVDVELIKSIGALIESCIFTGAMANDGVNVLFNQTGGTAVAQSNLGSIVRCNDFDNTGTDIVGIFINALRGGLIHANHVGSGTPYNTTDRWLDNAAGNAHATASQLTSSCIIGPNLSELDFNKTYNVHNNSINQWVTHENAQANSFFSFNLPYGSALPTVPTGYPLSLVFIDTSGAPDQLKHWDGAAWVNA